MSSFSNLQPSISSGEWKKETLEDGRIQLYRNVKIGENSYRIKVKYNERLAQHIDNPEQGLDSTLKKVIEESEQKILDLVASLEQEAQPIEKVTMKTDLVKRTSTVSLKALGGKEGLVSFNQLSKKNVSVEKAASGLIHFVVGRCLSTFSEADSVTIRFVENKPASLSTHKKEAVRQLKSILTERQKRTNPKTDEHGVKRWPKFKVDGQAVEVKEFEEGAYNGPVMEDFKRRQQLVYRAASAFLNDNVENVSDLSKVSKALVALDIKFQQDFQSPEFKLDYTRMKTGIEATDYFMEINSRQVELIGQFASDVQAVINGSLSSGEFTVDDIDAQERKEVMRRGRPIIVNLFTIQGQQFFSMQTPETKDSNGRRGPTIPSTLRDRPGLANYVSTSFGTISKDQKISVDHFAIRHSSYGPIAVEDACLRQAYAVRNVRQLMTDLAAVAMKDHDGGESPDDPIVIPLRSMMLLTPLAGDQHYRSRKQFIKGEWTGESESQQLKESALALATMRDRVVPLRIKGRTVYVKLDNSFMNLGANKEAARVGMAGKIPLSSYEGEINSRGYFDFLRDVEKHLLQAEMPADCRRWLRGIIEAERQITGYRQKKMELQAAITESRGSQNEQKKKLEELYRKYERTKDPQVAKYIEAARSELVQMEKNLNKMFGELYELRIRAIHRNSPRIEVYQNEFNRKLKEEIDETGNREKKQELKKVRDIFENYVQAKGIYESKAYRQPETVMEFQTLYLQTYEMIGYMTEFFCKSAEDRTGRVDNKIQERHAFSALNHRQALGSDADRKEVDEVLAPAVHQYSASRDNTRYNSDSPGLQITHHVNPTLTAKIDRANATMAKRVILKAKSLSPRDPNQEIIESDAA